MNIKQLTLARKSLDRRFAVARDADLTPPPRGWMKAIREALGMSTRQLAARMGVAPSRVTTIEKAEILGTTTIKTLREAAAAMNCTFVYAFVPTKPLDAIMRDRAREKAAREILRLDHTMTLENQALRRADIVDAEERLVTQQLEVSPRQLWND